MSFFTDPAFWARLLSIVVIDLSLAGDNALVIAMATHALPARQQLLGRVWGTAVAVGLRIVGIAVVSALLEVPLLQMIGGLLLLWIAVKLVRPAVAPAEGEAGRRGRSLREAVWIIVVADVTMSLDNVLAVAAAARGELLLVTFGIALSLPLVVWGSGLLSRLMVRHPWIIWLGGGVLGYVAGEMMMDDPLVRAWMGDIADRVDDPIAVVLAVAMTALGWWVAHARGRGGTAQRA
jgi:YjbE family integral membrane protein